MTSIDPAARVVGRHSAALRQAARSLDPVLARRSTRWARRDSNPQPSRYERPALTIELQAPPPARDSRAAAAQRKRAARQPSSAGSSSVMRCSSMTRLAARDPRQPAHQPQREAEPDALRLVARPTGRTPDRPVAPRRSRRARAAGRSSAGTSPPRRVTAMRNASPPATILHSDSSNRRSSRSASVGRQRAAVALVVDVELEHPAVDREALLDLGGDRREQFGQQPPPAARRAPRRGRRAAWRRSRGPRPRRADCRAWPTMLAARSR